MSYRKCRYKDLDKWRKTKNAYNKRYYTLKDTDTNNGKTWKINDIELIMEHKFTDRELSKILNRSIRAIHVKRSKIKNRKVEE